MIASIIAGLSSIPFTASTVMNGYQATTDSLDFIDNDTTEVPQKFTRNINSDSFEQTIQTPYGKFYINVKPGKVYQKLTRPNMSVIVEETPELTKWKLTTQKYILTIERSGTKTIEEFSSPNGYLKRVKEMGNVSEKVDGNVTAVETNYKNAENTLVDAVSKMAEVRESLPSQKNVTTITTTTTTIPPNKTVNITYINYTAEWVEIENYGGSYIPMTDWTLSDDGDNHIYTFPDFTLYSGNTVKVYSGDANDNCTENQTSKCWISNSVWVNSGDKATLKDSEGEIVDTYYYGQP